MKQCPSCQKEVNESLAECPFCNIIFSKFEKYNVRKESLLEETKNIKGNNSQPNQNKRPVLITIACFIGFYKLFQLFQGVFIFASVYFKNIMSLNYFVHLIFKPLLFFIAMVGYWKMKKWGVYVFGIVILWHIFIYIRSRLLNVLHMFDIVILIFIITVGILNFEKMN